MPDLNHCAFIGRLGKDPELKYMQNGKAVCGVSIACSERWKDQSGQQQERTEWVNVVFYDRRAEVLAEYCAKGSLIYVDGKLRTRKWKDKEGNDRYTTEIIGNNLQLLSPKGSQQPQRQQQQQRGQQPQRGQPQREQQQVPDNAFDNGGFDDDIPF